MSGYPSRIGPAVWVQHLNMANVVSNITRTSVAGIAVPVGFRHEVAHLHCSKNTACTLKVYGGANFSNSTMTWALIDTVTFSEKEDETTLIRGVAAFSRLQCGVNAVTANAGYLNTSFGFSE